MKKFSIGIFLIFMLVFSSHVQGVEKTKSDDSSGVKFEKMAFEEVLAKALKENKQVMIDAYSDT